MAWPLVDISTGGEDLFLGMTSYKENITYMTSFQGRSSMVSLVGNTTYGDTDRGTLACLGPGYLE